MCNVWDNYKTKANMTNGRCEIKIYYCWARLRYLKP